MRVAFSHAMDLDHVALTDPASYRFVRQDEESHYFLPRAVSAQAGGETYGYYEDGAAQYANAEEPVDPDGYDPLYGYASQQTPTYVDIACIGVPQGSYRLVTQAALLGANGEYLPAGSEFALVAYGHPRNRKFRLWDFLPEMHRLLDSTGDLKRLCDETWQPIVDELLVYTDKQADLIDPDRAPAGMLDLMLADLGNPFPFELTEAQKRALTQTLVIIYRRTGTAAGLEQAIRFFVRVEATVVPHYLNSWILGVSELGVDTVLGGFGAGLYSFDVEVEQPLDAWQVEAIAWLADRMKASHEHFVQLIQP